MSEGVVDVVVVGAGPAGCSTAMSLARAGHGVLVLERARSPRDKVCGDGLAPRAVAALRDLGLESHLRSAGYQPVREYRIVSSWGESVRAAVPPFGKGAEYSYVVPRRELDALLVALTQASGAEVVFGMRAVGCTVGAGGRPVVTVQDAASGETRRVAARVVVAADGSRGSFSRLVLPSRRLAPSAVAIRVYMEGVEIPDRALGFFLERHLLPGYGWVFPSSSADGPANVGVGFLTSSLRRRPEGLRDLLSWFLSSARSTRPYLGPARAVSPPAAFPLLMGFPRMRRRSGPVLFAGDVAGLIDPLSGEGIGYALESGAAAADAIAATLRTGRPADLGRYPRAVRNVLGPEFLGAYALRRFLALPWGNGAVIRLMRRDEGLARVGVGVLSNSVPVTWLARPRVLGRALSARRWSEVARGSRPAGA